MQTPEGMADPRAILRLHGTEGSMISFGYCLDRAVLFARQIGCALCDKESQIAK